MKKKIYLKYLLAPLSMMMVFSCAPDQYQNQNEYDDIYFTKKDRKTQPQILVAAQQETKTSTINEQNTTRNTVPVELQEKYSNADQVTYFEESGPRVQSSRELNYQDFVYDYENGHLAYYELPVDWETDWSEISFDNLMANDFQFRMAWYDQYYEGQDWRMRQYLSGRTSYSARNSNFNGPRVGIGLGFNTVSPWFYGGMMSVDLNPWGMYDPFWNPICRYRRGGFGYTWGGFGYSWGNAGFWGSPFYCPPFNTYYPGGINNTIIINNPDYNDINRRTVVRGGRLAGERISTVSADSQNGSQLRTRSQRLTSSRGGISAGRSSVSMQRINNGARTRTTSSTGRSSSVRLSRNSVEVVNRSRRVNTDANHFDRVARSNRLTRSRISSGQISSGRSLSSPMRSSRSNMTNRSVSRNSFGNTSSNRNSLSFSRSSSSSFSRSSVGRSRDTNSSRGFSLNRNSGFSRSSGSSFSRSSGSSRSTSSFSRGSSSSSSTRTSSTSSSRSTSSTKRSGRN